MPDLNLMTFQSAEHKDDFMQIWPS